MNARQMDLSELMDPPSNGTRTSDAAAESIRPSAANLRNLICAYIAERGCGGATADEIERVLRIAGNTVRPRILELRNAKRICLAGRTRPTVSGRQAEVYIAVGP